MPKPLPPPLPPESRTIGQLVAESIRLYGRRFWATLALGLSVAAIDQISAHHSLAAQTLILWACMPLLTASYVGAFAIAGDVRRERLLPAFALGLLVFAPVPVLLRFYLLPALAWLALFGLAVPASLYEGLGFRSALVRARQLAAADYVHALGSGDAMPTYILLSTLTVQGVQTLKSNPDRLRAVNKDVEELGCKVLHQWATLGEFDFLTVVEAPDEATIARVSVSLGARGSTKIQTLPALDIDDFLKSIESN